MNIVTHSHSDQQFNTNIFLPFSCDTVKIEYLFIFNIYSSRLKIKPQSVCMNYNKWQICIALIKTLRKYWKILNFVWAHLIFKISGIELHVILQFPSFNFYFWRLRDFTDWHTNWTRYWVIALMEITKVYVFKCEGLFCLGCIRHRSINAS